ncbi:hypothetical protein DFR60_102503 [Hungatella effluvii]|uniref:Uncharacterized protein n=1 Tax=Hungatella effluvii TaxID=1096246 RepID=A0A2V3YAN1_9FIRM|nr:hypothetical protein DFR60_102503 [Hungatella effluvii]
MGLSKGQILCYYYFIRDAAARYGNGKEGRSAVIQAAA